MRLSQQWTAKEFFKAAFRDLGYNPNDPIHAERYDIINEAVEKVYSLFSGLMINSYMTSAIAIATSNGNYSASSTGTYTPSTGRIVFNTMYADFTSSDIGKLIGFRVGTKLYAAYITGCVDTNTVTVSGNGLPTGDAVTVDYVMMFSTIITSGEILLGDLPINRAAMSSIVLESSATKLVNAVSLEALRAFVTDNLDNKKRIVYTVQENKLLFGLGASLSNSGTLTVYYPRLPLPVSIDAHALDLPDGLPCQVAMNRVRITMAIRQKRDDLAKAYYDEMYQLVEGMYRSFGQLADLESTREKVKALA